MPKYSPGTGKYVQRAMHEFKRGQLKSSKGGKAQSRRQAITIGLAKARQHGQKVPKRTF